METAVNAPPELSKEELARYSRHLLLPEVGIDGQQKLKAARVLCIGVGGLGSPLVLYLAAAGVGTLGLVDFDTIDASNLQRQILYSSHDVGVPKLDAAEAKLRAVNPFLTLVRFDEKLTAENAFRIFQDFDIVVDGSDNFPTRYLVNDACVLTGKPNVYGSIFRFEGQASVFAAKNGPCYRCVYPTPPPPGAIPSCAEGGVLGVLPGLVGTIQATETLKLILNQGDPLIGRLLVVDTLGMRFHEMKLRKNPNCPLCGERPTIHSLVDYEQFCSIEKENTMNIQNGVEQITPEQLKQELDAGNNILVLDVREPHEYQVANIGGQLIPMNDLPKRMSELDPQQDIVVHCKSGGRSQVAAEYLKKSGFTKVRNMAGGILAWSDRVDPKIPKY